MDNNFRTIFTSFSDIYKFLCMCVMIAVNLHVTNVGSESYDLLELLEPDPRLMSHRQDVSRPNYFWNKKTIDSDVDGMSRISRSASQIPTYCARCTSNNFRICCNQFDVCCHIIQQCPAPERMKCFKMCPGGCPPGQICCPRLGKFPCCTWAVGVATYPDQNKDEGVDIILTKDKSNEDKVDPEMDNEDNIETKNQDGDDTEGVTTPRASIFTTEDQQTTTVVTSSSSDSPHTDETVTENEPLPIDSEATIEDSLRPNEPDLPDDVRHATSEQPHEQTTADNSSEEPQPVTEDDDHSATESEIKDVADSSEDVSDGLDENTDRAETVSDEITEETPGDATEEPNLEMTEDATEGVTEEITSPASSEITEGVSEEVTGEITEEPSAKASEEILEEISEEPDAINEATTEGIPDGITDDVIDELTEDVTAELSEETTEDINEETTEEVIELTTEVPVEDKTENIEGERSDANDEEAMTDNDEDTLTTDDATSMKDENDDVTHDSNQEVTDEEFMEGDETRIVEDVTEFEAQDAIEDIGNDEAENVTQNVSEDFTEEIATTDDIVETESIFEEPEVTESDSSTTTTTIESESDSVTETGVTSTDAGIDKITEEKIEAMDHEDVDRDFVNSEFETSLEETETISNTEVIDFLETEPSFRDMNQEATDGFKMIVREISTVDSIIDVTVTGEEMSYTSTMEDSNGFSETFNTDSDETISFTKQYEVDSEASSPDPLMESTPQTYTAFTIFWNMSFNSSSEFFEPEIQQEETAILEITDPNIEDDVDEITELSHAGTSINAVTTEGSNVITGWDLAGPRIDNEPEVLDQDVITAVNEQIDQENKDSTETDEPTSNSTFVSEEDVISDESSLPDLVVEDSVTSATENTLTDDVTYAPGSSDASEEIYSSTLVGPDEVAYSVFVSNRRRNA